MQDKRYVIIGNGVAGTSAAETLRKLDPSCSIHLLTNEPYPLYNRVSLPRFLQGVITEQKVMIRDFAWHEQRAIQLITETLVTTVNTDERVVVTERGQHLPYDALLVATGVGPIPCGSQEPKAANIFTTLSRWMIPRRSSLAC
jgi:NAD(P)H-nitrite reductase large subunit